MNIQKQSKTQEKVEVPMEAAMPCKRGTKKHLGLQETEARSDEFNKLPKSTRACVVEAHESMRVSSEKIMKITSQAKDTIR